MADEIERYHGSSHQQDAGYQEPEPSPPPLEEEQVERQRKQQPHGALLRLEGEPHERRRSHELPATGGEAHSVDRGKTERERKRVDPGDVEPTTTQSVGRGKQAAGHQAHLRVARLARHQPIDQGEAGQRGQDGDQAKREVVHPGDPGERGGHDVIEGIVEIGNEFDRGGSVDVPVGQEEPDMVHHGALHPLQVEGIAGAAPNDPRIGSEVIDDGECATRLE